MKKYKLYMFVYFVILGIVIFTSNDLRIFATELEYVACGPTGGVPKVVPQIMSVTYTLLMFGIPLVLIGSSVIALIKAIASGNGDNLAKARSKMAKKFLIAALAFSVALIVRTTLNSVANETDGNDMPTIAMCIKCFLTYSEENCPASESGNDVHKGSGYDPFKGDKIETHPEKNSNSSSNDSSGVPASGTNCGSDKIYKGKTYSLTDSQKQKIAAMVYGEYSGDLVGMKAVASQMANLYEYQQIYGNSCGNRTFYNYITSGDGCKWYATYNATYSSSKSLALQAVEDVLIKGNRTLPLYINEFDMFPGDIKDPLSADSYIQGQTQIRGKWGGSGVFWCITKTAGDGNLFYYSPDFKKKRENGA